MNFAGKCPEDPDSSEATMQRTLKGKASTHQIITSRKGNKESEKQGQWGALALKIEHRLSCSKSSSFV
eukprot:1157298-Pelagomonas_calceolata.AAC.6